MSIETKTSQMYAYLMEKLGNDFDGHSIINWAEQMFNLKPFNLVQISLKQVQICHLQILKKYEKGKVLQWPDEWHKYQRKIFIQILICFCKIEHKTPLTMDLEDWEYLSSILFNKNPMFLKFQAFTLLKIQRKIKWTFNDDKLVKEFVRIYGEGNWNQISKKIFYKSDSARFFTAKQIRERWYNHISQKILKGPWTEKQDILLMEHVLCKNRHWCEIVKLLGKKRTQHMIKNRFKILIKKSFSIPKQESACIRDLLKQMRKKFGDEMKIKKKFEFEDSSSSINLKNTDDMNKESEQIKTPGLLNSKEEKIKMEELNVEGGVLNGEISIINGQVLKFFEFYKQLPNFEVFPSFPLISLIGMTQEKVDPFSQIKNEEIYRVPWIGFENTLLYNIFSPYWPNVPTPHGYQYSEPTIGWAQK